MPTRSLEVVVPVVLASIAMLLGPLNWWPSTTAPVGATPATNKPPAVTR